MFLDRAHERELIARALKGDRAAAGELLGAHERALVAYLTRVCGSAEVAGDIAQEAFYRALVNLDRFDTQYRFSTWLFTIARRVYLNSTPRRRATVDVDSFALTDKGASPDERVARVDSRGAQATALKAALATLPLVQREAVVLFHQQQWSLRLISTVLGIPEGTVKSHLHRGRVRLRIAMQASASVQEDEVRTLRSVVGVKVVGKSAESGGARS